MVEDYCFEEFSFFILIFDQILFQFDVIISFFCFVYQGMGVDELNLFQSIVLLKLCDLVIGEEEMLWLGDIGLNVVSYLWGVDYL